MNYTIENIKIAVFLNADIMGSYSKNPRIIFPSHITFKSILYEYDDTYIGQVNEFQANDLKFHCSWDWLVEAIRKIHQIVSDLTNDYGGNEHYQNILDIMPYCDIEQVYQNVIGVINDYNKNS